MPTVILFGIKLLWQMGHQTSVSWHKVLVELATEPSLRDSASRGRLWCTLIDFTV